MNHLFMFRAGMRLSLQTDYSLRTLMFLAARPGRQTISAVAGFFRISETHVAKVVNQLSRLGYVRSIRGIGGGLELARPATDITIGQVIAAIEGNLHLLECVGVDNVCIIQQHCKLRTVLDQAERLQREYLNSVRLSDVLPFKANSVVELSLPSPTNDNPATQPPAAKPRKKSPRKKT